MRKLFVLSFILINLVAFSQTEDSARWKVDIKPAFPGKESGWRKYLESNLNPNVPVDNGAPNGRFFVIIQFIVRKNGDVSDVTALTKHGHGMEKEAMRIIKKGPKWEPAILNGEKVDAYHVQQIVFEVQGE
jgi:protein TonB